MNLAQAQADPSVRVYKAYPVLSAFHRDRTFVRGILGPFGSGKSSASCAEAFRVMNEQQPFGNTRRTRGVVVRNTYRELADTVIPIWDEWFGTMGELRTGAMIWRYERIATKTEPAQVHEVLFRSLDKPGDIKKLLSLNITWAWVNEAREVNGSLIEALEGRLGRFPSKDMGGPSWFGMWMDTNPPDELSWWYRKFEIDRPQTYKLFRQPSGLDARAENVENLPPDYYQRISAGKSKAWVKVYVHGEYGFVGEDGKQIYDDYKDEKQCFEFERPERGPLLIGCDWGLTPAAVIAFQTPKGQYRVIDEIVTQRMGAARFATELSQFLRHHYPPHQFQYRITGDPAGVSESQTDEQTPFRIMNQAGLEASPAYTNDYTVRVDTVNQMFRTMDMAGDPSVVIHPRCKVLRQACNGGYRLRRVNTSSYEKYAPKPDKDNPYSHVAEALQYMLLGAGEGHNVIDAAAPRWMDIPNNRGAAEPLRGFSRGRR